MRRPVFSDDTLSSVARTQPTAWPRFQARGTPTSEMMTRTHRLATVLLALACSLPAAAGNSTKPVSDMYGLFVVDAIQTTSLICSRRFPDTEVTWTNAFQDWKVRNAKALDQLHADTMVIRQGLMNAAFDPSSQVAREERVGLASLLDMFAILAATGPYQTVGVLNDAEAKAQCSARLADAKPGGEMDRLVTVALDGAEAIRRELPKVKVESLPKAPP